MAGILDKIKQLQGGPVRAASDGTLKADEKRLAELEAAQQVANETGSAVLLMTSEDVIAKEWNGFEVKMGLGSYPPNVAGSHRQAIYCKLYPRSDEARAAVTYDGSDYVLGGVPLTAEGATLIAASPNGPEAEEAMKLALAAAQREAMKRLPKEATRGDRKIQPPT